VATPNYGIGLTWNSFIERNLTPRGVFFVGGVPNPEPGGRRPPKKKNPQNSKLINFGGLFFRGGPLLPFEFWVLFFQGGPLLLGSWFGNHPTKKSD